MSHVAHVAVRNRGTIGGSLSHADPAAELPLVARLLDATLVLASSGGNRTVAAADFFRGALTTSLEDGEIVTEIRLPYLPDNSFWGFREMALRSGDFAIAAAAVTLALDGETCTGCRIAVIGSESALRVAAAEDLLTDAPMTPDAIAEAARVAAESAAWNSDLHASAEFRRQLVAVLTERALSDAWARSRGERP
jgi:carbon-monoxide dehydrogenase medium subunit